MKFQGFLPFVTRQRTTALPALTMVRSAGADVRTVTGGVARAVAFRHATGPFVTESPEAALDEPDNRANPWQGAPRHGWFDAVAARYAFEANGRPDAVALTHLDSLARLGEPRIALAYALPDPEPDDADEFFLLDRRAAGPARVTGIRLRDAPALRLTALVGSCRPLLTSFGKAPDPAEPRDPLRDSRVRALRVPRGIGGGVRPSGGDPVFRMQARGQDDLRRLPAPGSQAMTMRAGVLTCVAIDLQSFGLFNEMLGSRLANLMLSMVSAGLYARFQAVDKAEGSGFRVVPLGDEFYAAAALPADRAERVAAQIEGDIRGLERRLQGACVPVMLKIRASGSGSHVPAGVRDQLSALGVLAAPVARDGEVEALALLPQRGSVGDLQGQVATAFGRDARLIEHGLRQDLTEAGLDRLPVPRLRLAVGLFSGAPIGDVNDLLEVPCSGVSGATASA